TGNNSYSGTTTILSGSLQFGTSSVTPSITPTGPIVDNGTLTFATASGSMTFNQIISGTGAVTNTTGNVSLGGANTFSGITTISAGTITLTNPLALSTTAVTAVAGTLAF